ncbi:translocation/assembly module TamB domain-containing protein [Actibacterium sp. D379-3]
MRYLLAFLWVCLTPLAAFAQDAAQTDRGVLQAFLEDNLSDAGRDVRIIGFKGALSSRATIEELTIADADGIWLTLRDVVLDWSRAALLGGRLEVRELTAAEIVLPRLPGGGGVSASDAEATPFQLPDLPVSVNIGKIRADKVVLGAPVLGEAAEVQLDGSLSLAGGAGKAALEVARIDDEVGTLTLDAAYVNETDQLTLDLALAEGPGGIVSTLLSLPSRPALSLAVTGDAPLSDFTADIKLASDGQERLAGQVRLTAEPGAEGAAPLRRFSGDLGGDIAPLFAPDLRPFFGPAMQLSFAGARAPDGRLDLSALSLSAAAMTLDGSFVIGADGMPERFDLTGRIAGDGPVLLPLSGPETRITRADITAGFDAARGEGWTAQATVLGLSREGLALARGFVTGTGTISRSQPRAVTADLQMGAEGIAPADPAFAAALGDTLTGSATLAWQAGVPLRLSALELQGAGLRLTGQGALEGFANGYPVSGDLRLNSDDFSRFSGLAGRPLAGAGSVDVTGSGTLLGGAFDIDLRAGITDLQTGTAQLDPLLAGRSLLYLVARRGATGTVVEKLTLDNTAISASASGTLNGQAGGAVLSAQLADLAPLAPGLTGPATLEAEATWTKDAPLQLNRLMLTGAGAVLTASGAVVLDDALLPATGTLDLRAADLAPFSRLAGRPLRGALNLAVKGSGQLKGGDFDLDMTASGQNLAAGLGDADRVFAGASGLSAQIGRKDGRLTVGAFALTTPQLTAALSGGVGEGDVLDFTARLADLGLLVPDFPGPVAAQGTIRPAGPDWQVALDVTGPGGTEARIGGQVAGNGQSVAVSAVGSAPLGLANTFIAPRSVLGVARFDLRMDGAPGLAALSGSIATSGARVSAPTLGLSLTGLDATVGLSGGQATISASGSVAGGGRLTVNGPVGLSAPYVAGLQITAAGVVFEDPALYRTTVNGAVAVQGPLTGGSLISGTIELGQTEIQVPSTGAGPGGEIPDGLTHVNEPADVRITRGRAGLIGAADGAATGGGGLGLDLTILAPSRIFVRGRGLDAELGGRLRLTGTTSDVVPVGRFELIRGRLDILGKRLTLVEGAIRLQGAFNPYIRLVAETQSDDTTVQIVTEGPLSEPEVSFLSQPELPQDEVLARLLFGRGITTLSPLQAAQLAGAVATLAGRSGGGIVAKLRQGFGLDDLNITSDGAGATQLRAGKYLSENIYTDVTVDSAGTSEINLNLDLLPNVTVKGGLGDTGDTSLGIFYERDY